MLGKSDCASFYDVKNEQFQRKMIKNAWVKNNKVQKVVQNSQKINKCEVI